MQSGFWVVFFRLFFHFDAPRAYYLGLYSRPNKHRTHSCLETIFACFILQMPTRWLSHPKPTKADLGQRSVAYRLFATDLSYLKPISTMSTPSGVLEDLVWFCCGVEMPAMQCYPEICARQGVFRRDRWKKKYVYIIFRVPCSLGNR